MELLLRQANDFGNRIEIIASTGSVHGRPSPCQHLGAIAQSEDLVGRISTTFSQYC
jgi:hypothetical protein